MKITRIIYSEWGTAISTVTISGTTLKKLAIKYGQKIEQNGNSFSFYKGNQLIIYSKK